MPPEETSAPEAPAASASSSGEPMLESSTPTIETPTPAIEPATLPEAPPAPAETVPAPDSTGSTSSPQASSPQAETDPASAEATAGTQPVTPTAQIPPNEPLPPEPEPFDSPRQSSEQAAQDKPTPEPPSAAASTPAPAHPIRDFLNKARIATQDRKRKKRDKIMQYLNSKTHNGSTSSPQVTNDEVEKLLHVSDATATRYLSALEKENKIKQVGKTGTGVVYQKI